MLLASPQPHRRIRIERVNVRRQGVLDQPGRPLGFVQAVKISSQVAQQPVAGQRPVCRRAIPRHWAWPLRRSLKRLSFLPGVFSLSVTKDSFVFTLVSQAFLTCPYNASCISKWPRQVSGLLIAGGMIVPPLASCLTHYKVSVAFISARPVGRPRYAVPVTQSFSRSSFCGLCLLSKVRLTTAKA